MDSVNAETNIKKLSSALNSLTNAVAKSGGHFTLEDAGSITQALKQSYDALSHHQNWLLSERK